MTTGKPTIDTDSVAQDQLRAFFERWQRLNQEKQDISDDLKELFAEARANGFDTKVMKPLFRDQTKDRAELLERQALYDLYEAALTGVVRDEDEPRACPARSAREIIEEFSSDDESESPKHIVVTEPVGPAAAAEAQPLGMAGGDAPSASPAPIQPETANEVHSPADEPADANGGGSDEAVARTDNSTQQAGAGEGETSSAPGSIIMETTPPVSGMHRHPYLACFPEHWGPALADLKDDIRENGVREPIQRQGTAILDGWSRYLAARELGIAYPVQEYAGDDPLADIIGWNMESRKPNLIERQAIAKKLMKLVPDRADEISELLDLNQMREAAE